MALQLGLARVAQYQAASRVNPTCGDKPGHDASHEGVYALFATIVDTHRNRHRHEHVARDLRSRNGPTDLSPRDEATGLARLETFKAGEPTMYDSEYQRKYFKKRYAEDPEFRRHRAEVGKAYRLRRRHGIPIEAYEAALASQQGACAACRKTLGRIVRVDRSADTGGTTRLLCARCSKGIATVRHVLAHASAFAAYFKDRNMTSELSQLHTLLRQFNRGLAP